jgi:hypothetical protein
MDFLKQGFAFFVSADMLLAIDWFLRLQRELGFVEQLELLVWMSTIKNLKLVMHYLLNNTISTDKSYILWYGTKIDLLGEHTWKQLRSCP